MTLWLLGLMVSGGKHIFLRAFAIFTVINLGLTLFASAITTYIVPAATRSSTTELKAYLNGVDASGIRL